jgi:hypothetical protein
VKHREGLWVRAFSNRAAADLQAKVPSSARVRDAVSTDFRFLSHISAKRPRRISSRTISWM